jgi:RNA polymerase sigma-70 factor, ECF subfamily
MFACRLPAARRVDSVRARVRDQAIMSARRARGRSRANRPAAVVRGRPQRGRAGAVIQAAIARVRIEAVLKPNRLTRQVELRDLADEDLMALVRDGQARAFEIVFDRHAGPAFSLAYRMCGRRSLAEEVVQEAFLSLWRSGARYDRTRGSVRSWVMGVVHNRAIDALRRHVARDSREVADEGIAERLPAPELTELEAARREESDAVRGALGALPSEQRQVIELAYFGGFTHSQIAQMLDAPVGTVKGRMRLGLTKLRMSLGDQSRVAI